MPKFYTSTDVILAPFVFVSYSHADRPLVEQTARTLLDQGVRLWWDTALEGGQYWKEEVRELIVHPNCRGVIFMCSPAAYLSTAVHNERTIALEERAKRGEQNYRLFVVNVCDDAASGSYMHLLKDTFAQLPAEGISDRFRIERLNTLMELIGRDPIAYMTGAPGWQDELLKDLIAGAEGVVKTGTLAVEAMQKVGGENVVITLGKYQGAQLRWQLIFNDNETGRFILQDTLPDAYGDDLDLWLNGEFRSHLPADAPLEGPIRLLTKAEYKDPEFTIPPAKAEWWLQDCIGSEQAYVESDGEISPFGQVNHLIEYAVRPVITMNMQKAIDYVVKN